MAPLPSICTRPTCGRCDDPLMAEYGNGVSQSTGGGSQGGQSLDAGAAIGQMITDAVNTVSALPPTTLLLGFMVLVIGLLVLKRAF